MSLYAFHFPLVKERLWFGVPLSMAESSLPCLGFFERKCIQSPRWVLGCSDDLTDSALYQWFPKVWRLRPSLIICSSFALYRYMWIFRMLMVLVCLDFEILYCPYLYGDYTGGQELHFEFMVLPQDRKPAQQRLLYQYLSPLLCLIQAVCPSVSFGQY